MVLFKYYIILCGKAVASVELISYKLSQKK